MIETNHSDVVHDTQLDYYGQLVATASSDGTVKVFSAQSKALLATLTGHEGPVWMVAWGHPRFGNVLASASFDRRVFLWKEGSNKQWKPVHLITVHTGSVNSVQWAPQEYGSAIATASSDGSVAVTVCEGGSWRDPVPLVSAANGGNVVHALGSTAVAFAPYQPSSSVLLATAGCDAKVLVWTAPSLQGPFTVQSTLQHHGDWVRDVAFHPDASAPYIVLASCGQDKTVVISRQLRSSPSNSWESSTTTFTDAVWRLSWSPCGSMLLVTTGDSEVFLLKEGAAFTDAWLKTPLSEMQ